MFKKTCLNTVNLFRWQKELQGYPSTLRLRFCVPIAEILLSLPDSAWGQMLPLRPFWGCIGLWDHQKGLKTGYLNHFRRRERRQSTGCGTPSGRSSRRACSVAAPPWRWLAAPPRTGNYKFTLLLYYLVWWYCSFIRAGWIDPEMLLGI